MNDDIQQQLNHLQALSACHVAEISALARMIEALAEATNRRTHPNLSVREHFSALAEEYLQAFLISVEDKDPSLAAEVQRIIDNYRF